MKKRIAILMVAVLTLMALTVTAFAASDYAVVRNTAFEAEQGNLFSTVFTIESDKPVEVLEFHLSYDKKLATLTSNDIFTIGTNTSIKYNDKIYVVWSEVVDGKPEYYFFETLEGCTDADKSGLTLERYYTNEHYTEVFLLEENIDLNKAMIAHIHEKYGMIIYDADIRINATNAGVISVSWLPRQADKVNGMNLFSLQFTIEGNLAAEDYDTWLQQYTGKDSFADTYNSKELNFAIEITPLSIYEYGDVNFDTKIDTRDALLARQHYLEVEGMQLTGLKFKYADVNIDGAVTTRDALLIQQKTIGVVDHVGNRYNVYFHDVDGNICAVKSVAAGGTILVVPDVPNPKGYINGSWSQSSEEAVEFNFNNPVTKDTHLYAYYEEHISEIMQYYVDTLRMRYANNYNRGVTLDSVLKYGGSASTTEAEIFWYYKEDDGTITAVAKNEANQYVLDQPGYDTDMTLQAYIISWEDGKMESQTEIPVQIKLKGKFSTPTKSDIVKFLRTMTMGDISASSITGGTIENDVFLPRKLTNKDIGASSSYEVRLEWEVEINGVEEPISEIKRTTTTQENQNYIVTVTFNGEPLEGDGKIYFDNVTLAPVSEVEIRNHIIASISATTAPNVTDGMSLWNNDTEYGTTVTWFSNNQDIITIQDNTITINNDAISGMSCPLTAQVTYAVDGPDGQPTANTFDLGYNVAVITNNSLLTPGVNMDASLYYALLDILDVKQLTTEHLKKTEFVSLDLSAYSDYWVDGSGTTRAPITDLNGLTYCENLFLLNISNLHITANANQICSLKRLETLIAKNADIETLKFGGESALAGMLKLKLLDLSGNSIKSLSEVLDEGTVYTGLKEIYLNDNQITDISAIQNAPFLSIIELSNNNIEDITPLQYTAYATKISLSNNKITSLNGLESLAYVTELRLNNNEIGSCQQLADLTTLTTLYLGNNNIADVTYLKNLVDMQVLFLNDNSGLKKVDALADMTGLEVLQISNCSITDLGTLYSLRQMRELYAENNKIGSFSFVKQWQNLEKLLLANNEPFDESEYIVEWLTPMKNLTTLTLSGRKIENLSFLVTTDADTGATSMKPIVRLELANCQLPAFYANGVTEGTVTDFVDNVSLMVGLMDTLRYLDVSGNELDADQSKVEFTDEKPRSLTDLRLLSQLYALYIDNTQLGEDAVTVTSAMTRLTHLSMENCGITSMDCLGKASGLVYVDLANNPVAVCDLTKIEQGAWSTMNYLYLDTVDPAAKMLDPGSTITTMGKNSILALSLEGYSIPSMGYIPQMNEVKYLDLSETGISNWNGTDTYVKGQASNRYAQSILRFVDTVEVLDVANDSLFTHDTLNMLYNEVSDNTTIYMYADHSQSGFNGQREFNYFINNWKAEDRTISTGEFELVSGNDWRANFVQFVEDYLGFSVKSWNVTNAGPDGAFTKGADGYLHMDDQKYKFQDSYFNVSMAIQVYDADESSLANASNVTINMLAGSRATITVNHRYWSVADTKNGSFNDKSGSGEVVTETFKILSGKSFTANTLDRSGFQAGTPVSFTVEGDRTIDIDYPRNSYTLFFNANGGNIAAAYATQTLVYGESTNIFDYNRTTGTGYVGVANNYMPTRGEHLFAGWLYNGQVLRENLSMPASDVILIADWVKAVYSFGGGTITITDSSTYDGYFAWYKRYDLGISDADWAKIQEYGADASFNLWFYIQEIDKGYQAVSLRSINTAGGTKFVYENKKIETAGTSKGSEQHQHIRTVALSDARGIVDLFFGASGDYDDDYKLDYAVSVTYNSKY